MKTFFGVSFGILFDFLILIIGALVLFGGCTVIVADHIKKTNAAYNETSQEPINLSVPSKQNFSYNLDKKSTTSKIAFIPEKAEDKWDDLGVGAQQGCIQVRVKNVSIDFVNLKGIRNRKSETELLSISLEITNTSPNEIINYDGWAVSGNHESRVILKDNSGNTYDLYSLSFSQIVDQITNRTSIHPQTSIKDILVFEQPIVNCEFLLLELPTTTLGRTGMLRIKIPNLVWEK